MGISYRHEKSVEYGVLETVSPLIRRIVARNPSAFTYHGTGTYVIGRGKVAVIDAGPNDAAHLEALTGALQGEEITHQLITHTHIDHSPAATPLREKTGARTHGYGPHGEGRYDRGEKVEAGGDRDFAPDEEIRHGDVITGDGWTIECVHTPGHCSNHMCFALREEKALFTGDHVMGWSTSIISPPDGDVASYMASLELLLERDDARFYPTHGPAIDDPRPFVESFIAHRRGRDAQIRSCLERGVGRIEDMVAEMYTDIPSFMHRAAGRSVFAHILHMLEQGEITTPGQPTVDATYKLSGK